MIPKYPPPLKKTYAPYPRKERSIMAKEHRRFQLILTNIDKAISSLNTRLIEISGKFCITTGIHIIGASFGIIFRKSEILRDTKLIKHSKPILNPLYGKVKD